MTKPRKPVLTREYKSRIFIMLYSDRGRLLELYNAVSGKNYQNAEELKINTLENAIYLSMKNDISFLIDCRLSLYEHQSTFNPNMPLRFLFYLADLYSTMTMSKNLYGTSVISLPTPVFLVFYNGTQEEPDIKELRLSDSYEVKENSPALELIVKMLNINAGHNIQLMDSCKSLREYAEYIRRIREYSRTQPIEDAVEQAISESISEGILRDFLLKNRAEVKAVSIYEYNEEEHMRMEREEFFEKGYQSGIETGRKEEKVFTEQERQRAERAEAEVAKLREELAQLKNHR